MKYGYEGLDGSANQVSDTQLSIYYQNSDGQVCVYKPQSSTTTLATQEQILPGKIFSKLSSVREIQQNSTCDNHNDSQKVLKTFSEQALDEINDDTKS